MLSIQKCKSWELVLVPFWILRHGDQKHRREGCQARLSHDHCHGLEREGMVACMSRSIAPAQGSSKIWEQEWFPALFSPHPHCAHELSTLCCFGLCGIKREGKKEKFLRSRRFCNIQKRRVRWNLAKEEPKSFSLPSLPPYKSGLQFIVSSETQELMIELSSIKLECNIFW